MIVRLRFQVTFILVLLVLSCSYKPPSDPSARPGKGLNFFPVWYDNMLGEQYGEAYSSELPVIENSRIQRGVEDLGRYLVRTYYGNENPPFNFEFTVVNLDIMNAFCLPGGKIFIFRGLLQDLESESELAGVLSHEMGHAIARHGTKSVSKGILMQGIVMAGTILLAEKDHEGLATVAYVGGMIGTSLTMLKYSRDHEREADWIAIHNVYRAGYDPEGMISLFQHFESKEKEGKKTPRGLMFLSTHPTPQERQKSVNEQLPKLDLNRDWTKDEFGFATVKAELESMPPAPKELDGKNVLSLTTIDSLAQTVAASRAHELREEKRRHGTQTVQIYVPSDEEWTNTAISVSAGQEIDFEPMGQIRRGYSQTGPEGDTLTGNGVLLGSVWKDDSIVQKFEIGKGRTIRIQESGLLSLGIRDDNYSNNEGWFTVKTQLH